MAGRGRQNGGGSGGKRQGAGRPPGRGKRLEFRQPSAAAVSLAEPAFPIDHEHAPDSLNTDERNVWLKLAPLAVKKGTLTAATAYAFEMLCRNVVLERRYAQSVQDAGGSSHRGMIQRVDAELGDFGLRAFGRSVAPAKPKATANPFAAFGGGMK